MLFKSKRLSIFSLLFLTVFALSVIPTASWASRYHVKTTGSRISGFSAPNDWSDANCYPSINLASVAAAHEDSVLLYREIHTLSQPVDLPQFLGNPDLDANNSNVRVMLASLGRMNVMGDFPRLMIRGISFEGDGENSHYAAIELNNNGGILEEAFIHNCAFTGLKGSDNNSAIVGAGSAIIADGDGVGAYLDIRDCHFEDNISRGSGGAVFFADNYEIVISDSDFVNNFSDNGIRVWDGRGGAIYLKSNNAKSSLTLVDCLVENNSARGPGGALFIEDGSLTLISTDILGSTSAFGGSTAWSAGAGLCMRGINGHGQSLRLEMFQCNVQGNIGDLSGGLGAGDGGGVLVKGISGQMVDVYVAECSFEDNYNHQGAGLYIGRFTTGEVERCSFRNNTAHSNGGASYKGGAFAENLGETVVYNYCEFVGNRAGFSHDGIEMENGGRGGAFCTRLNPRAFFYNCTFLENKTATNGQSDAFYMWRDGADFDDDLKRCRLINCLFYGESGQDIQINMEANSFGLVTHCAFEEGQFNCPGVEPEATVVLNGNPCTSLTDINLIFGSGCIDSALPVGLEEDLYGDIVPMGAGPDIGAQEFQDILTPVVADLMVPGRDLHSAKAWPNPFNPQVQIGFSLEQSMTVDVTIYDIRGSVVAHLFTGTLQAGAQQLQWDGRDANGRSMASGSYRTVISAGGEKIATRMTLVR